MEFIKLEQFKSLNEEIQKVFLNWWKPKRYDLFIDTNDLSQVECLDYINDNDEFILYHSMRDNISEKEDMIPLFTESQLRRFIENKINSKIEVVFVDKEWVENEDSYYRIERVHYLDGDLKNSVWITRECDLLQAYWKVALETSKEGMKEND